MANGSKENGMANEMTLGEEESMRERELRALLLEIVGDEPMGIAPIMDALKNTDATKREVVRVLRLLVRDKRLKMQLGARMRRGHVREWRRS